MKISEFEKLETKMNNQDFGSNYKVINTALTMLSYFGNIASIFLAYFFMSTIMSIAFTNIAIVFLVSIIILGGIELLKRDIFNKFSVQYIKHKSIKKDVIPLLIFSTLLIGASFYSSLSGAKEFSSKEKQIAQTTNNDIKTYSDSLTKVYDKKTNVYVLDITNYKNKLNEKDLEQSNLNKVLQEGGNTTKAQRDRNIQLKDEKTDLNKQILLANNNIKDLNTEKESIIKKYSNDKTSISKSEKQENNKNSMLFVIISTIIEFIILTGVFFNEYYKSRTYKEFKSKLDNDNNYQTWKSYDSILKTIFPVDMQKNNVLPKNKTMIEMCKLNNVRLQPKEMTIFLKLIESLEIIKSTSSGRYINKQRDLALDALKTYFNID